MSRGATHEAARGSALTYQLEPDLSAEAFRGVLVASGLASRRPADDLGRLDRMLRAADVVVTARDDGALVGIARAISDFAFACYLSDLAVATSHQGLGIGRRLIERTHEAAGLATTLYLVSAPAAESYYPHIGMSAVTSAWKIPAKG